MGLLSNRPKATPPQTPKGAPPMPALKGGASAELPKKLLISNRGEIAVRLMKTAHKLKIPTVAIFTSADIGSSHVRMATEHYSVPSYLDEVSR